MEPDQEHALHNAHGERILVYLPHPSMPIIYDNMEAHMGTMPWFLKINKEVHCSSLQQSAHAFQVDLLLHSPGPVETRNLVPEVCCCFKVTSKLRPLMASDNFTAKFPMIFEKVT